MRRLHIEQLFQATETHRPNSDLAGPQMFMNSSKTKKLHHPLAHLVTQVPEYQEWIYQLMRHNPGRGARHDIKEKLSATR